tara:strand:+ start:358 stop:864 length:507 start_codon:yes stop_codon:yes gene_type:complete
MAAQNDTQFNYVQDIGKEKVTATWTTTAAAIDEAETSYSEAISVPAGTTVRVLCNWVNAEIAVTIQGLKSSGGVDSVGGIGIDPSAARSDTEWEWTDLDGGALADNTAEEFTSVPPLLRIKAVATDADSGGTLAEELNVHFWYNPKSALNSTGGFSIDSTKGVGADPS